MLLCMLAILAFVGFMVVASRRYPRAVAEPEVEAGQELIGVGRDKGTGSKDPRLLN